MVRALEVEASIFSSLGGRKRGEESALEGECTLLPLDVQAWLTNQLSIPTEYT
jgi:hypothetical protein